VCISAVKRSIFLIFGKKTVKKSEGEGNLASPFVTQFVCNGDLVIT
jgi:hypothetical protein